MSSNIDWFVFGCMAVMALCLIAVLFFVGIVGKVYDHEDCECRYYDEEPKDD